MRTGFVLLALLLVGCGVTSTEPPAGSVGEPPATPDTVAVTSSHPDRGVLVALYHATDGPNWNRSDNWLTDVPLGQWEGVTTDTDGRVVELRLGNNGMTGSLPDSIGHLDALRVMALTDQGFNHETGIKTPDRVLSGPLPSSIGRLRSLEQLLLTDNRFSGPIPHQLGDLPHLRALDLWHNRFSGPIPPRLGNLRSLERLLLSFNHLEGPIPSTLSNLRNARKLDFGWNRLSGPVPEQLADLTELEELHLGGPEMTVCAPPDLDLRAWLVARFAHLYPCPVEGGRTALPRTILREDGNGVFLRIPEGHGSDAATGGGGIVAASVVTDDQGTWLKLAPASVGDAEILIDTLSVTVTVRPATGTFGADVVMGHPHPVGHEQTMMEVVKWWEYMLEGSDTPDRHVETCVLTDTRGRPMVKAMVEDFLLVTRFHPGRTGAAAVGGPCDRISVPGQPPGTGGVEPFGNGGGTGIIQVLRHEMGHALGLAGLIEASHPELVRRENGQRYFTGENVRRAWRRVSGDSTAIGAPIDAGSHWPFPDVIVGHRVGCLPDAQQPNAISMYALMDTGYVVDESKIVHLSGVTVDDHCGGQ